MLFKEQQKSSPELSKIGSRAGSVSLPAGIRQAFFSNGIKTTVLLKATEYFYLREMTRLQ
jgi:hypothetical protein